VEAGGPGVSNETLLQKQKKNKRTGSVAQVVKPLPSMQKVLGLIPRTEKEERKMVFSNLT
jgi:hypothetical protein